MGCLRKTKTVIKRAARTLGPVLLGSAGRAVQLIEDMSHEDREWWTSEMKREMAEAALRAEARRLKRDVPMHLIRLAIEHAVAMLNDADKNIQPTDLGEAITDEELESA